MPDAPHLTAGPFPPRPSQLVKEATAHRPLGRCLLCIAIVALLAEVSSACRRSEPGGLSREQFVATYVKLVRARIDTEGDPAAYAAARDRALREAGVDSSAIRAFVEARRDRPEELREAWQSIAAKLDTLYGGVTAEPPAELRAGITRESRKVFGDEETEADTASQDDASEERRVPEP